MTNLIAAIVFFIALHVVVAGSPLRYVLVARLGERIYRLLFAIASVLGLVWIIAAYGIARNETEFLWARPRGLIDSAVIVMFFVFLLVVPGLLTPNPTLVSMEGLLRKEAPVTGILRITRHPFLWGVVIWGVLHLSMTGHSAAAWLFGGFAVVAFLGTFSIDRKRAHDFGQHWVRFRQATSNVPFAAILTRRNKLKLGEVGALRWIAAVVAFAVVLYAHQWLFGKSPLPGGMTFY